MSSPTSSPTPRLRESLSFKSKVKHRLQSVPVLWNTYWRIKQELRRVFLLRYFAYDIRQTYKAMFWTPGQRSATPLSAELLFQYHKLEKGLSIPGPRRFFGAEPASATMEILRRWNSAGHRRDDPVYLGALEALHAYLLRLDTYGLDPSQEISCAVRQFLTEISERDERLVTPQSLGSAAVHEGADAAAAFRALALARRSVRDFRTEPVADELLRDAFSIAQLAPSACNRQPWFVYLVSDKAVQKDLLQYQNGNRGFGHLAPHVAVITAEESCFFDASERHEPYVDGGLFSMSLALALRAHGASSCCLNWCVPPSHDRAVHALLSIPASRRIIMLMAIGYAADDCVVPRSPRRALDDVLLKI